MRVRPLVPSSWTRRLLLAAGVLVTILIVGGLALWLVTGGERSLFETIYYTLITISTVGYGEMDMEQHAGSRVVTVVLILAGVGAVALFQSTLTAMFVEGVLGKAFRRRRMEKKIAHMEGHFLVCGGGRSGRFVVNEFHKIGRKYVLVDMQQETIDRLMEEVGGNMVYLLDDATEDSTLLKAGVQRAAGIVSALPNDRDNLFVTLSARALNPKARIITKVLEVENEKKMLTAGANATVSPYRIGGLRLVSELVRPHVTEFLDGMLRVSETLRFDEVKLPENWELEGTTMKKLRVRQETGALVVALREKTGEFTYNPSPTKELQGGMQLIAIVQAEKLPKLHELLKSKL